LRGADQSGTVVHGSAGVRNGRQHYAERPGRQTGSDPALGSRRARQLDDVADAGRTRERPVEAEPRRSDRLPRGDRSASEALRGKYAASHHAVAVYVFVFSCMIRLAFSGSFFRLADNALAERLSN